MKAIINKVIDWLDCNMAIIFAVGLPMILFAGLIFLGVKYGESNNKCFSEIAASGYKEADARAFINVTDFSCNDLRESDGAMAQFKRFLNGEEMTIKKTVRRSSTVIVPIYHR